MEPVSSGRQEHVGESAPDVVRDAESRAAADIAHSIVRANLYMTLATADLAGTPWATPVYFAAADDDELLWVSSPEATHSQNIAVRPEVGIVVFDSRVPIGTGQAVYMSAVAGLVTAGDLDRWVEVFSRSCQDDGGSPWSVNDVGPGSRHRLYRATANERWILDGHDRRIPVPRAPSSVRR